MAELQLGDVGVGLVGQEELEAMPVVVAEAQLGAGVGVLSAAQHPPALRPVAQVDPAGQRSDLGTIAGLPVGLDRGVQACSGWARIASRTWASICIPG
jgi:hypothetical protein